MAIFAAKRGGKKKGDGLPNLPELPDLPGESEDDTQISIPYSSDSEQEIKNLPSFPDSEMGNSLSQEAVKSAVGPKKRLTMEIPEPNFENIDYIKARNAPARQSPRPLQRAPAPKKEKGTEPLFIRIDKFKFAIDSFEGIKGKIAEVEKYLRKIREQKRKEYEEIDEWEKEIEAIKLRIEAVDNKIFSKL